MSHLFARLPRAWESRILPGFELTSTEGIHILCIYPPKIEEAQLACSSVQFGITKPEPSSDLSNKNFVEILRQVRKQGGVSIAAHVTSDHGLLRVLDGQARIKRGVTRIC